MDHCVVDPRWLAFASRRVETTPHLEWHPKIRWALRLVAENAGTIDQNYHLLPGVSEHRDEARGMTAHKKSFFRDKALLDRVLHKAAEAYEGLFGYLRNVEPDLRERALHTYAAASSLRLIRFLQLFEGKLLTDEGRLLMRLFPDLPSLKRMRWAVVGLPYQHPVNGLAYGLEGDYGFLECQVSRGRESDYKCLYLPRRDAETFQDEHPGPLHLYWGWVVPEWLLFYDDPPPAPDAWWITVLSDELGRMRYTRHREAPWSGEQLDLRSEYEWPTELYERTEIEPGISCWIWRRTDPTPT